MKRFLFLLIVFLMCVYTEDLDDDLDKLLAEAHNVEKQQQIVPSNKFSLDSFLKEMDELECESERTDENYHTETFRELCEENLQEKAVAEVGNFREGGNQFYDFLNENIFLPLAFDVSKKGSISEQLVDLINLNDNNVKIDTDNLSLDFGSFENQVLQNFVNLEANATNPGNNQQITDDMIEILKSFHVHWNSLRIKDQLDRAKGETQNLMRKILQQYEIKEKFQFEVIKTVIDKIKLAYKKFIMAHKQFEYLRMKAPDIIARLMVFQYQIVANNILFGKVHEIQFVQRLSTLGQFLKQYYIGAYKIGYTEQKCLQSAENNIANVIRQKFDQFLEKTKDATDENKKNLKYFTATFLLKMKYINHKIFRVEGILTILSRPIVDVDVKGTGIMRLYFELKDLLMVVPQKCVSYLQLKNCVYFEINKTLKFISGKFKLKRSTGGWSVYEYLVTSFQNLFSKTNQMVWGNFTLFKNYYYQNLFAFVKNMKYKYIILEDRDITQLEDTLTQIMQDFEKNFEDQNHLNYALIDVMQKRLYYRVLYMKASFNENFPIKNNPGIISAIHNSVLKFLKDFQTEKKSEINDNFITLLETLKDAIDVWRQQIPKKMDYTVQISELPLSSPNLYPQIFHTILQNPTDSKFDYTIKNQLPDYYNQKQDKKQGFVQSPSSTTQISKVPGSNFGQQYITNDTIGVQQYPSGGNADKVVKNDQNNQTEEKQDQHNNNENHLANKEQQTQENDVNALQTHNQSSESDNLNLPESNPKQFKLVVKNHELQNSLKSQKKGNKNDSESESESEEQPLYLLSKQQFEQKKHDLYNKIIKIQQKVYGTYDLQNLNNVHYINKDPKLLNKLQKMYKKMNDLQQHDEFLLMEPIAQLNQTKNLNENQLRKMIRTQVKLHPEKIIDQLFKKMVPEEPYQQADQKIVTPMYVDHVPYSAESINIKPEINQTKSIHQPIYEQLINYHTLPNHNFQNDIREQMDNETEGGII